MMRWIIALLVVSLFGNVANFTFSINEPGDTVGARLASPDFTPIPPAPFPRCAEKGGEGDCDPLSNPVGEGVGGEAALNLTSIRAYRAAPLQNPLSSRRDFVSACARLTAETPRSAACDAEISAHPLPPFEHPVTYDAARDAAAIPRSIMLPAEPFLYPVGWQRRAWYFSDAPGQYPEDDYTDARRIPRETMFNIYHSVEARGEVWYLIGIGQWMRAEFISVLQIPARPPKVSGHWIALDLRQQTLVAMIDDTPIFATLICSGYHLQTTLGLFHIYARTAAMTMRGPPGANPPLYVFDTTWVMFFNEHQGLHAMPYHNDFGIKRTHGCVNVPPGDELWLWDWVNETADEWDPNGTSDFFVEYPDAAPWVYVYESEAIPQWAGW